MRRHAPHWRNRKSGKAAATEFKTQAAELETTTRSKEPWELIFTEQQINAWLIDELPRHQSGSPGVSDPLVDLTTGVVRVGARANAPQFRGLVSVEIRPSIEEGSQLILEVDRIRAGELPIPAGRWIRDARRRIAENGWPVEIVEEPSLRIEVDLTQVAPPWNRMRLSTIAVAEGRITLRGEAATP